MPKTCKKRIDILLVEKGLVESREKAKALIMAGKVFVNDQKVIKPSQAFCETDKIYLKEDFPYVSRGGIKLEGALKDFKLDVKGKIIVDVGCSTGGFTDCLLKHGAKLVYAVDVGKGVLDWKLRNNPKVVVMEGINARYLQPDMFPVKPQMATIDVSFISLKKVLPPVIECLTTPKTVLALVKPQFEAERRFVKKGVVKDPVVHKTVLDDIIKFVVSLNMQVSDLAYSKIMGSSGNIEFFLLITEQGPPLQKSTDEVVRKAWKFLKKENIP